MEIAVLKYLRRNGSEVIINVWCPDLKTPLILEKLNLSNFMIVTEKKNENKILQGVAVHTSFHEKISLPDMKF